MLLVWIAGWVNVAEASRILSPTSNRVWGSGSALGAPAGINRSFPSSTLGIAVDAIVSQPTFNVTANTVTTWSHTVSGGNRLLTVSIGARNLGGAAAEWSVSINGILASVGLLTRTTQLTAGIWYLQNPSLGVHTIAFHASETIRGVGSTVSYTGVLQSGLPVRTTAGSTGTGTPVSTNITATANDLASDMSFARRSGATLTVGAMQTQLFNIAITGSPMDQYGTGAGSYEIMTGGADTLSWTLGGGGDDWAHSVVVWIPQ
jgi:hypothetical protein